MTIDDFCANFDKELIRFDVAMYPWEILDQLAARLNELIPTLGPDFTVADGVAIHKTARVDPTAQIQAPTIIGANCFIGPNSLLRGGIYIGESSVVGPMCEVKRTIVCSGSAIAHFNYVGDSVIGSGVDLEAGAMVVNYYNERDDKEIYVHIDGKKINTHTTKFGALIGDNTKIGANAVVAPGAILPPETIVKRLELLDQN